MPMSTKVPFGTMLRAARLRFYYVDRLDCFIRISSVGKNFLVELRPNNVALLDGYGKQLYRDISDPEELISLSPVLSMIKSVKKPIDMILNEQGERCGI